MGKREFSDRIIRDGLPDGWFIQDRLDEKVALLVKETPGMWPGSSCVCLKPNAITTDEWLATAKQIAIGFDAAAPKWEPEIEQEWCQPGDIKERQFLVTFDDPDCRNSVFSDEARAREFWGRMSMNWNCYLFGAMPRTPSPQPREVGE
ncbi:hypothetical protein [Rhizobium wuzhouense]|uniref:Uncharacterized protein n=1 Tax=Rhizobium wuzhouense TaxID=1986026 RepID=A0ABX5NMH1_9HYPH|nr:hypothetical protein [Rhizobium wuzhouense]PYB71305.1 hypothetical protein DMY87_18280 [Rhizobium wuzhouense]